VKNNSDQCNMGSQTSIDLRLYDTWGYVSTCHRFRFKSGVFSNVAHLLHLI
jgi:hypothetical protein